MMKSQALQRAVPLCVAALLGCTMAAPRAAVQEQAAAGSSRGLEPLVAGRDFHAADTQLEELITVLLRENPRIQSARALWLSRLERVPQERSLPDPLVSYRYFGSTPETRVGPQNQGLELSQGIPWFHKRGLQAQRAEHLASGVAWRVRDLERVLVAELKRAYFNAAYLQEAVQVNAEETNILKRFEQIALTRYSTGEGIQQSVVKVQTEISRLADQDNALRERLDALERRIAQLLGRSESDLQLAPIRLKLLDLRYDRDELESKWLHDHPEVRAVQQQIEADETLFRRRKLESRPDFRFGVGYTEVGKREDTAGIVTPPQDNGQDIWAVTVGLNLPIHRKKIRAGVAEAEQSVRSNERLLQSTRDTLQFEIQESLLRLESLDERTGLYKDVIIPQAEESLASAEAAYTTNRQDFLDLLDAERVLFQVRLTSHRLLADYWIALGDLELGLGRSFPTAGSER